MAVKETPALYEILQHSKSYNSINHFGVGLLRRANCVTFFPSANLTEATKHTFVMKKGAVMNEVAVVKSFATVALLLAFLIVLPGARADEANQATEVTFDQPVQIPGRVLPAGTYWFILPRDVTQHYVVRIFSSDRTMLYATLFTIDAERPEPSDHTAFTFAERGGVHPEALLTWFYPGDTTGHEFVFPKQVWEELAKGKQDTVMAGK
jgi:Protein of unknown function (DUF2911)